MVLTSGRSYSKIRNCLPRVALVTIVIVLVIFVTRSNDNISNFEHNYSAERSKDYHELPVELQSQDHEVNEHSTTKATTSASSKTVIQSNSTKVQPMKGKLNLTRDDLMRLAPDIFRRVPTSYLPNYRSFCWLEGHQLWCLPYFYIIGFHKCGTTDIFDKLELHPSVLNVGKEPHWWALRRAGLRRKNYSLHQSLISEVQREVSNISSFSWYLHWFKHQNVLRKVEHTTKKLTLENGETINYHPYVFGDGSVSTLTTVIYDAWDELIPNGKEDPDLLPYLLHAVQPLARIIITVRDPVQRIKSMFARRLGGSSKKLHQYAVKAIECATDCMAKHSVRQCAYYSHCQNIPQIYLGIYIEFIRPWAMVYGKANILILRMEDRMQNPVGEFKKIIEYLDLETLPRKEYQKIMQTSVFNKYKGRKVDMSNETKTLLQNFYRPFNRQMAAFMNDDRYNFGY